VFQDWTDGKFVHVPQKISACGCLNFALLFLWGQIDFVGWVFLGGFLILLKRASYLGEIFGHEWGLRV
jgi:hypothetical protein